MVLNGSQESQTYIFFQLE